VALHCTAEGDVVRFEVSDTGGGIPPERLDDIFEPYVRLDDPQSARVEGSGLGLAISREFALAMGGNLTVRSTVGAGSVFTLGLPRAKADEVPAARDRPPAQRQPTAA
jgi:signal transduction histidine kinase